MRCIKCGHSIKGTAFCPACGFENVHISKAINTSKYYYNLGLEKAQVRDLGGAQECLERALFYDKSNVEARNLLGLVCYEMGERGKAYKEWKTSDRMEPGQELKAALYVRRMEEHPAVFEEINETAKKFNQALTYAKQGSDDLALIQIKKVISVTPNFVRGHILFAILHMRAGDQAAAKIDLKNALAVDPYNATAARLMQELGEKQTAPDGNAAKVIVQRDSDNLKNVRPVDHYEDPNKETWKQFVYMLIGLAIGIIAMFVLVIPSVRAGVSVDYNKLKKQYKETVDEKDAEISDLKSDKKKLKNENKGLKKSLSVYEGTDGKASMYDNLLNAYKAFEGDEFIDCAEYLSKIDKDDLPSKTSKDLYNSMSNEAFDKAASQLYNSGMEAYNAYKDAEALEDFEASYKYKKDYNTLYQIGMCCKHLGKKNNGKDSFYEIINDCEDGDLVRKAANYGLDLQIKDAQEAAAKAAGKTTTQDDENSDDGDQEEGSSEEE